MKMLFTLIAMSTLTACSGPYKPGNSLYGKRVRQAYLDGCLAEARKEYGAIGRDDLIGLRAARCVKELEQYTQE